jgi:predicted metal-dependent peptidase
MAQKQTGRQKHLEADEKMVRVKTEFILDSPFFASIFLGMELREATVEEMAAMPIHTIGTDGRSVIWCKPYVDTLGLDELIGVMAHEVMHVVAFHHLRRGQRDPLIWNIAADFAINPSVTQSGFILPEALSDYRYESMDAETIYNHLIKLDKNTMKQLINQFKGQQGKDGESYGHGVGWVSDQKNQDGSGMTPSEVKQAERKQKAANEAAAVAHRKMCGNMPAFLKRMLDELLKPRVNWREALAQFVEINAKSDYNWSRPNNRFVKDNVYLPQIYKPEIGTVVNGIDASGSIGPKEIQIEVSELQGILWAYEGVTLQVIFFDTRATEPVEITEDTDIKKLKVDMGGGTDYKPFFAKVEQRDLDPVCIIVLTDGYCDSFPAKPPEVPVLWILINKNPNFNPPYGDVIHMDLQD